MNYQTAEQIWRAIQKTELTDLRDELIRKGVRYAQLRVSWQLSCIEERLAMDATRTAAHDGFIDACNILSRNMQKQGEGNGWREVLGTDRKAIGDFACHLHAMLGIAAR